MQKISAPARQDRSSRRHTGIAHEKDDAAITASGTGTTIGLAGSDVLAERMNPDIEVSSTDDPSEFVEVTPESLVNRNAPGSMRLIEKRANNGSAARPDKPTVVRRNANAQAAPSATSGPDHGADGDVLGASGGTAAEPSP